MRKQTAILLIILAAVCCLAATTVTWTDMGRPGQTIEITVGDTYKALPLPASGGRPYKALISCEDNDVRFSQGAITPIVAAVTIDSHVGGGFANQPNNDGIEILSSAAGDTTQTVTLYGTTTATETVVVETVSLTGTTVVSTTKTNWGYLLGAELSAATAGNVTIREASGNLTITTIAAGGTTAGITNVAAGSQTCYNSTPTSVADAATTKYIGIVYQDPWGVTGYQADTLNGTTAQNFVWPASKITKVLWGDVEAARTFTVKTNTIGGHKLYMDQSLFLENHLAITTFYYMNATAGSVAKLNVTYYYQ